MIEHGYIITLSGSMLRRCLPLRLRDANVRLRSNQPARFAPCLDLSAITLITRLAACAAPLRRRQRWQLLELRAPASALMAQLLRDSCARQRAELVGEAPAARRGALRWSAAAGAGRWRRRASAGPGASAARSCVIGPAPRLRLALSCQRSLRREENT